MTIFLRIGSQPKPLVSPCYVPRGFVTCSGGSVSTLLGAHPAEPKHRMTAAIINKLRRMLPQG